MDSQRAAYYDRYIAAWNSHDPEAVVDVFAEDGTVDDPATDGKLTTDAELREWAEELFTAFPDAHFEVQRRTSNDDVLFVEYRMDATHGGPLEGVPPTYNTVELYGVEVVTISEDGITSIDGYFDPADIREDLGLTFPEVLTQVPDLAVGAVKNAL